MQLNDEHVRGITHSIFCLQRIPDSPASSTNPSCCALATACNALLGDGHVKFHATGGCAALTAAPNTPAPGAAAPGAFRLCCMPGGAAAGSAISHVQDLIISSPNAHDIFCSHFQPLFSNQQIVNNSNRPPSPLWSMVMTSEFGSVSPSQVRASLVKSPTGKTLSHPRYPVQLLLVLVGAGSSASAAPSRISPGRLWCFSSIHAVLVTLHLVHGYSEVKIAFIIARKEIM